MKFFGWTAVVAGGVWAAYKALKNHRIAGAGLDVFEEEPMRANHPLLTLINVIVTPHIAYLGTSFLRGLIWPLKK